MKQFEYPIYPERGYRIDVDGEKYYITGKNIIELAVEKIKEQEDDGQ